MSKIEIIDQASALGRVETYLRDLQNRICAMLEQQDGQAKFQEDPWQHQSGGGGLTRALSKGGSLKRRVLIFLMFREHSYPRQQPKSGLNYKSEIPAFKRWVFLW